MYLIICDVYKYDATRLNEKKLLSCSDSSVWRWLISVVKTHLQPQGRRECENAIFARMRGGWKKTYIKASYAFFVLFRFSSTRFKLFSFLNGKFITYSIYYTPRPVPVIPPTLVRYNLCFICCPAAINSVVGFGTRLRVHHRRDTLRVYTFRFHV